MDQVEQGQAAAEKMEGQSCCMCGDVGFSENLLPCPACRFRFQHTYCSRMYPKIITGRWRCEWCLHSDQQHQQQEMHRHATVTTKKHKGDKRESFRVSPETRESTSIVYTPQTKRPRHRRGGEDDGRHHPKHNEAEFVAGNDRSETAKLEGLSSSSSMPPSGTGRVSERWVKSNRTFPSPRVVGQQRYKLLADVLY